MKELLAAIALSALCVVVVIAAGDSIFFRIPQFPMLTGGGVGVIAAAAIVLLAGVIYVATKDGARSRRHHGRRSNSRFGGR